MSTPTVIRAAGPRDFLSVVPALLGYTPTESVCLIPFVGKRTSRVMRFDLPPEYEDLYAIARTFIGLLCKIPDADGMAVVVFTEDRDAQSITPMLTALNEVAGPIGMPVRDLLYVAADGWGSLIEGAEPRPLSELVPPEDAGVHAPAFGLDQHSMAILPNVPEDLVIDTLLAIGDVDPYALDVMTVLDVAETCATAQLDAQELALLHWILDRPSTRDVTLVTSATQYQSGAQAMLAQLDWQDGEPFPEELAMVFMGIGNPDPDRLKQALANVRTLARITPLVGVFAAAAWLAWALGRATEAQSYALRGLASDPEHVLCGIVHAMTRVGHLPEWAFTHPAP